MPDVKHFDPEAALDVAVELFWRRGAEATGVRDVVEATGVNRSSLYATFGGKRELYVAALRRYSAQRSEPVFRRLAEDTRGLPALTDFFRGLVEARCSGPHARWGCLISNAHADPHGDDPDVRAVLHRHHDRLRTALASALGHVRLRPHVDVPLAAELLATLAYGVNLRSRAGADRRTLDNTVTAALAVLTEETA
jgi:TetR/AcrR family transcriptional regulator, transcriptional repressor for nem operon